MKLPRFYLSPKTELTHTFWLHDKTLLRLWHQAKYRTGQELVLFDGVKHDRLYRLEDLTADEAHLKYVTDMARNTPPRDIYLFWPISSDANNKAVLQKGSDLGISHFVPLVTEHSAHVTFDVSEAQNIIIRAVEQATRSDIPSVRSPLRPKTALKEFADKVQIYLCQKEGEDKVGHADTPLGLIFAPHEGWAPAEEALFKEYALKHLKIADLTLPPEGLVAMATPKLLQ